MKMLQKGYILSVIRAKKKLLKGKEGFNKNIYMKKMKCYSMNNLTPFPTKEKKERNHTWFWCSDNRTINITCFSCNSRNFKKIRRIRSQMCHYKTDRLFPHRANLPPGQHARWVGGTWWRRHSPEGWRRAGCTP